MVSAQHSSKTFEHMTPLWVVEAARKLLGDFDLDPATTVFANETRVKAKNFYTEGALDKSWFGRVFLNPPGGRTKGRVSSSLATCFWAKLVEHYLTGEVTSAFFVMFNIEMMRTSQVARLPATSFPMIIPRKRVAYDSYEFGGKNGKKVKLRPGNSPPHSSAFVWLPPTGVLDGNAVREAKQAFPDEVVVVPQT